MNHKNIDKTLILSSTSNPWINNGLIAFVQELNTMKEYSENKVNMKIKGECVSISSEEDGSLYECVSQAFHNIAERGTYNFSATFKIINKESGADYTKPKEYPDKKGDAKATIEILEAERAILKKRNYSNAKKQQVWKMRMSYLGTEDNYLKIGLNLKGTDVFKKLREFKDGKEICPVCGMSTNALIEMKQFFNPLSSEHHNNIVEGFSTDIRKKVKACPKCIILCYFSLFNYRIPFFYIPGKETYLAIPNTVNMKTLRIINNNISLKGQYVAFSDSQCTSYSTNIRFLPHKSKSASMLTLLHNIKNKYSEMPPERLNIKFEEITKEKFIDMIEWLFISKNSHEITHIRADENVYEILDPLKDPKNDSDVYLVPDVLCNFSFGMFNENEIERFYNGILKLNAKKISEGLFSIVKESISKSDRIWIRFRAQGSSPLYLFEEVFLDKIMEVSTMLKENIRKACKEVAETVGKGFSEDVGMMTKFAYASGPEDFRNAMADALFRLAKTSALNKDKNYWLDEDNIEEFLGSLESAKFDETKSYFVSFMSVYALSENYKNRKTRGGK